jgi:hypothetical protein
VHFVSAHFVQFVIFGRIPHPASLPVGLAHVLILPSVAEYEYISVSYECEKSSCPSTAFLAWYEYFLFRTARQKKLIPMKLLEATVTTVTLGTEGKDRTD